MSFAKQFGARVLIPVLTFSLFGLASTVAINRVFSQPDNLKQTLEENRVYDAVAEALVSDAIEKAGKQSDIPLQNKAVQSATRAAVTPELIQTNSEKVIDSTYAWLEGETPTPEFKLDTKSIKDQVATNVSKAGQARVAKLSACSAAQLQQLDPQNIDPFSVPCRPPGLNLAALQKQYQAEIARSDDVVSDSTITASDLNTANGQNVFSQAERVPQAFQLGQVLPWVFVVVIFASIPALVFLHTTKWQGIRVVSGTLLMTGLLLVLTIAVVSWLLGRAEPDIASESVALQDAALSAGRSLNNSLSRTLALFAGVYCALGTAGYIWSRMLNKNHAVTTQPPEDARPTDDITKIKQTDHLTDDPVRHRRAGE